MTALTGSLKVDVAAAQRKYEAEARRMHEEMAEWQTSLRASLAARLDGMGNATQVRREGGQAAVR